MSNIKLKKSLFILQFILSISLFVSAYFLVPNAYAVTPSIGNWNALGLDSYTIYDLAVDPANSNILYAAVAGNGIFKSTDSGENWVAINNGLPTNLHAAGILIDPNNSLTLYTAGGQGIWKSIDGGTSWINIINDISFEETSSSVMSVVLASDNSSVLYLGIYKGGLWKSEDSGMSWTKRFAPDTYTITLNPTNSDIVYVGGGANEMVSKSFDGGRTWINAIPRQLGSCGGTGAVRSIAIDFYNPNILYAGPDPAPCATAGIYKSIDGNLNWVPLPGSPSLGASIITNPVKQDAIYAARLNNPYQSIDAGVTWTNIRANLPNVSIRKLIISPKNPNVLYAATSGGVYVYGLEGASISLPVPLFKQGVVPFNNNNPLWEGQEFDHANAGQFYCGKTMAQCGCATTSVAMILNYHGIKKLPNGEILDPGTLNTWLKNNQGYNRNLGIKWAVAATLARKAKAMNPDFHYDALEVDNDWTFNATKLANDLEQKIPNVLQQNTSQGTHFVVATGIDTNEKFTINDPFYDRTSLTSYGDIAASVRRFVPANSDMSYITFAIDPEVNVLVKDQQGNIVGNTYIDYGPGNPTGGSSLPQPGSIRVFEYAKPETGTYTIEVTSTKIENYQLDITLITQDGEIHDENLKGIITSNTPETFSLAFDKQSTINSNLQKNVTFESALEDIKELKKLNLLHFSTAIATTALVKNAEYLHEKKKDRQAENLLDVAIKLIQKSPKKFVHPTAKEILLYDFNQLQTQLSN